VCQTYAMPMFMMPCSSFSYSNTRGVTYIFSDVEPIMAMMDPPSNFVFENIPPILNHHFFVKKKHFVF
jgi:hypothetical protein